MGVSLQKEFAPGGNEACEPNTSMFPVLDRIKSYSYELDDTVARLMASCTATEQESVKSLAQLKNLNSAMQRKHLPELFEEHVDLLNEYKRVSVQRENLVKELEKTIGNYREIRSSESYLLGHFLLTPLIFVKSKIKERLSAKKVKSGRVPSSSCSASQTAKGYVEAFNDEFQYIKNKELNAAVDNRHTGFEVFSNWVSVFHYKDRCFGAREPLLSDQLESIYELNSNTALAGKRVLELGALEGANTKQMLDYGAAEVTAIEFNRESYLKSLIAKNEFGLDRATFLFGDCNYLLEHKLVRDREFDLVLASGLLYHMEDPIWSIELMTRYAPIVYVWSHVASERAPDGPDVVLSDTSGRTYHGKRNSYVTSDALGGVGYGSVWLTPESMKAAFIDRGFEIEELGGIQNFKGDAIKFIARKQVATS